MPPHVADTARASGCGKPGRALDARRPRRRGPTRERIATPFQVRLAVRGDLVAAVRQLVAEQLGERVVGELRLLQADDVRPPLVEPRQQPRHPLLERVDVPGRDAHGLHGTGTARAPPRAPSRARRRLGNPLASWRSAASSPARPGLRVRGATRSRAQHDARLAGEQTSQPAREVAGWGRAQGVRHHRQPVAHGGRLVVDDVEDSGRALLEREDRGRGRVIAVDERRDPASVAHDRELALADPRHPVVPAVEAAVAKPRARGRYRLSACWPSSAREAIHGASAVASSACLGSNRTGARDVLP